MKASIAVLALFCATLSQLYAQHIFEKEKRDYVWLIGNSPLISGGNDMTMLNFNSIPPGIISTDINMDFWHTNASVCDASGNLLFYTNGIEVRNFINDTLATGLAPTPLSEDWVGTGYGIVQGALILPLPESDSLFFIFHVDADWAPHAGVWVQNLFCTKVDMSANNGLGTMLAKNVSIINDTLAYGRIVASRHANGRDWWIIVPQFDSNQYYTILFTSNGIEDIQTIEMGEQVLTGGFQSSFSPDGKKYARIDIKYAGESEHQVTLYDFDRCTGVFTNPISFTFIDLAFGGGGLAFSENSRFLYVTSWFNVYQFDLNAPNIEATMIKVAEYDGFEDPIYDLNTDFKLAQLGPNGKIYIACGTNANYLHIIHTPNNRGLACNVEQHGLELAALNDRSIPNFPYYALGPLDGSPCDTLGIDNPPPQAAFSYAVEDSAAFQVAFYDGTRFSPESWLWDFGDGQSSTERFPVHAYAEAGVYEVCLTAGNQTGSDTFCDTVNFLATGAQEAISMPPGFSVFPNPASSRLAVSSGRPFVGQRLSLYS
ncbi:MAG: PKD domain-containing protein, partial [Phaeodactylibacter sp.]|nr:PKD domain-containing protein [Phaeodactylibacter sp.]